MRRPGNALLAAADHRRDFFRVMRVVVNDIDAVDNPFVLEPPAHTGKRSRYASTALPGVEPKGDKGRDGGQRIAGIVRPGTLQVVATRHAHQGP